MYLITPTLVAFALALAGQITAAALPSARELTSIDGFCGLSAAGPVTCRGSSFGTCCSKDGTCASNKAACGGGCQAQFGLCDVTGVERPLYKLTKKKRSRFGANPSLQLSSPAAPTAVLARKHLLDNANNLLQGLLHPGPHQARPDRQQFPLSDSNMNSDLDDSDLNSDLNDLDLNDSDLDLDLDSNSGSDGFNVNEVQVDGSSQDEVVVWRGSGASPSIVTYFATSTHTSFNAPVTAIPWYGADGQIKWQPITQGTTESFSFSTGTTMRRVTTSVARATPTASASPTIPPVSLQQMDSTQVLPNTMARRAMSTCRVWSSKHKE